MIFDIFAEKLSDINSAKRTKSEKTGVHNWHEYYAGYSEKFVEDILSNIKKDNAIILDPWNGSGTTTLTAQRLGFDAIGIEINPVMVIHANAKNLILANLDSEFDYKVEQVIQHAQKISSREQSKSSTLSEWLKNDLIQPVSALFETIKSIEFNENGISSFLQSALFQTYRQIGKFQKGSNPTWITGRENMLPVVDVFEVYRQTCKKMIIDIGSVNHIDDIGKQLTILGDARKIPFHSNTFDAIITSPPYCTRIDYAISTKPELSLLGCTDEKFRSLRQLTMGAPVIVNKSIQPNYIWGETCNNVIQEIANHYSKASKSYYLHTYLQYFQDAELSLREVKRVLCKNGFAIFVLQNSYYKEIEIPLSKIYREMALNLDLHSKIVKREIVRQHMAHINQASRKYKENKLYFEDILLISKV